MEIDKLSIADLKAALDFVKNDLNELEKKALKEKINLNKIPAYNEVQETENKLYHRLLHITRSLV
jgi:hypothetical protein